MKLVEYLSKIENVTYFEARSLIVSNNVYVNSSICNNVDYYVQENDEVKIKNTKKYVTRSGEKLAAALSHFNIEVYNKTCIDCGASEGGFTDCLLQHGAKKIYAVDVAYGILDWKLRNDQRVVVLEKTNARYVGSDKLPEIVDLVTVDVSFISSKKILTNICNFLTPNGEVILLYKPQFELLKNELGKNGAVIDYTVLINSMINFVTDMKQQGICFGNLMVSPIKGNHGNIEFLLYADASDHTLDETTIRRVVEQAFGK